MKNILISLTVFNKDIGGLPLIELVNSNAFDQYVEILITDNSDKPWINSNLGGKIKYEFSGFNGGTRQAVLNTKSYLIKYNKFDYVLFLDQDTQVDFLTDFLHQASQFDGTHMVFVPEIRDQNDNIVSPCSVNYFGGMNGSKDNYDTAILSGALASAEVVRGIEYIPKIFWLDYLDHYLFFNHFPKPKLLSFIVKHNLSVSTRILVSKKRLMNIYFSELAFYWYSLPKKMLFGIIKFIFNFCRLLLGK